MSRQAVGIAALVWLSLSSAAAAAPEPWADRRLPAADGLVLWLDASRQNAARQTYGKPELHQEGPVDTWYDASGHRCHLAQPAAEARPVYQAMSGAAAVRFDGSDDFLAASGLGLEMRALTVFVVAAPYSNAGDFRALLAANATGKNDYTSGLTVDLGPAPSSRWQSLNVEGAGFVGAANLLGPPVGFGGLHRLTMTVPEGAGEVALFLDGRPAGKRPRAASVLRADQFLVGARFYSNEARPPYPRGFFDGDLAEVLVYDCALPAAERQSVEKYLAEKYAGLHPVPPERGKPGGRVRLVSVPDPPPVQVFLPGFTVRRLPVDLPNVNNVRYRADGKLMALGYNGNVYLLSDADGDGLEDRAELFWENHGQVRAPVGMALTPPGYKHGNGVFVACKGKLSLLVDTDGDGKADREIVVASGWKEIPHGVDALGAALDREGNVYFGLGTADYTNPYLVGKDGRAAYDPHGERGTILKVAPDFSHREIVATGIRFPVGLAFNREGDLFATDQEGATWLANGNPLDELLHIQPGRHYGFPPQHPRYLPHVLDEPSVFDYGPQHQSTCGLAFNEPVNGGPVFGPSWWAGDAVLAGYSRGKVYRTQLVKTPAGYVARTQLLACLNMLAIDACVSPRGDLVVAVHSGAPDWGSGPEGKGRLYKITYRDREQPQPVLAWAAGPREARVAFDRPLDPARLRDLARRVKIEYGRHVLAGDRFESLRPGYAAVERQLADPRYDLSVLSAAVTADRRTLVLTTAPHAEAAHYAVTLPGFGRPERPAAGDLPQQPAVDLDYDLCGVEARWQADSGGASWSGWLPHLDTPVSQALTRRSAEHDNLWPLLGRPGRLTLRTKLDLWHMLHPAVQPGSSLDFEYPPERVTLTFTAAGPITVTGAAEATDATSLPGRHVAHLTVTPREGQPVPVEVTVTTGSGAPLLAVAYATNEDERPRALPLHRSLLPWATTRRQETAEIAHVPPELQGGDWARGRAVFFSDQAQCARCHRVRGEGGRIGPDLSNLVQRDYASVLRDVREPNAALNPDYLTSLVELTDGRVLVGVVRDDGPSRLVIGDAAGKEFAVARDRVESVTVSPRSTMPEGLDKALGPEKLRDLLTFLLLAPLDPAPLEAPGAPPPRSRAEVEAVLAGSRKPDAPPRPLRVLLSAGPKDHGPGEHDYPLWQRRWARLLRLADGVTVREATGWPTRQQFEQADLVVMYSANPGWSADKAADLDAFLARGGGLVLIHYAVNGGKDVDAFARRIGLAWQGGVSRFRHGPLELSFPDRKHPVTRGFDKLRLVDESYWQLQGDVKDVHILATGVEEGSARPLLWARQQGKGRIFVSIPGHFTWTFDDPLFRVLLLRGMAWAAGDPVDRFNGLVTIGARLAE
jgi:putative heme-binding domain-containing protein